MQNRAVLPRRAVFAFFLFLGAVFAQEGRAAPNTIKSFAVVDTALHAEGPKAEWCLSFSKPLSPSERGKFLEAITLRKDSKKMRLSSRDLSVSGSELCLQNLDHRSRYDVLLRRIESSKGKRLSTSYDFVFAVPDRKPFLAFVSDSNLSILPRHVRQRKSAETDLFGSGTAHVLRSVNVDQTHLTLYKIPDPDLYAKAWQQFMLINLSPTESLYFAQTKGKAVFESDLIFSENPNTEQTLVAPLPPDSELSPGLYYLAAAPKNKTQSSPGLSAGQWFLVSDLRLSALMLPDGIKVFAGDLSVKAPASGVEVQVLTREGEEIKAARTGADGTAFLSLEEADGKKAPALLIARKQGGDADILDIGRDLSIRVSPLPLQAFLRPDRESYRSGTTAIVALRAEDSGGRFVGIKDSFLKLLRSDRRVYSEQAVTFGPETGPILLSVPLPIVGKSGEWILSWQKADGSELVRKNIRLVRDPLAEKVEVTQLREEDGAADQSFLIKALDAEGKGVPFRDGVLLAKPERPKLSGWKGFSFGVAGQAVQAAAKEVPFVTGPDGTIRVELPVDRKAFPEADAFLVKGFLQDGAESSALTVSARRPGPLVGVKLLTEGAAFAENGLARFEVVALDSNGKRRAENNLHFLVFEEGRSFEWFPSEGHWDYRPLPQHRRIGGGALTLSASGEDVISWPVATGQYVLEIVDETGAVLVRQPFEAGRVAPHPLQTEEMARLRFVGVPKALEDKQENRIKIHLDAPALVGFTLFDGAIRISDYRFMKAGVNEILVTPSDGWGTQAVLKAQAQFLDSSVPASAEAKISVHRSRQNLVLDVGAPRDVVAGAATAFPVKVQKIQGRAPTFLSVVATPLPTEGRSDVPSVRLDRVPLDPDGRGIVRFNLPLFEGRARLTLTAWNDSQYGEKSLIIPVRPALIVQGRFPARLLPGDQVESHLKVVNQAAPGGIYDYKLTVSEGLLVSGSPLQGKLSLKKGQTQSLPFTVTAQENIEGTAHFEISGLGQGKAEFLWPISVEAEWTEPWLFRSRAVNAQQKTVFPETAGKEIYGLLSPLALPSSVGTALQKLAAGRPYGTVEISSWFEAIDLWSGLLRELGLMHEARLEALRAEYLREIQRRQNEDGGVSAFAPGQPSDMAATAAALVVLQGKAERPAALAADWLLHKMQNTWFDETEREARAVALEALSRTRRGDLSAIRYFAETSKGKISSISGAAFVALALTQGGDPDAAAPWLEQAQENLAARSEGQWEAMRLLALNEKISFDDLAERIERMPPLAENASLKDISSMLAALARCALKGGGWQARWGERKIEKTGLFVLKAGKEAVGQELSAGDRRLFLMEIDEKPGKKPTPPSRRAMINIDRKFIKLDGEEVSFDLSLNAEAYYILLLSGEKSPKGGVLRFLLAKNPAFEIVPLRFPSLLKKSLAWLPELRSNLDGFTELPAGYGFAVEASEPWRVAVLVKAVRRGAYTLPFARAFAEDGTEWLTEQNALRFSVW